jgi:hypothetical protein
VIQEMLFAAPAPKTQDATLPPEPPKLVVVAEPLGQCCKAGCHEMATRQSPSGNIYCESCGRCGGKYVEETALGVSVRVCGRSVEEFVMHRRLGIWCCPCLRGA